MITGAQIHEARKLLGLSRDLLAPKAGLVVALQRISRSRDFFALDGASRPTSAGKCTSVTTAALHGSLSTPDTRRHSA